MAVNKKNWFKMAGKRLKSETPAFFKKAQRFFIYLTTSAVAMYAIPEMANKGLLSEDLILILQKIASYMFAVGAVGSILTKLPTTDTDLQ